MFEASAEGIGENFDYLFLEKKSNFLLDFLPKTNRQNSYRHAVTLPLEFYPHPIAPTFGFHRHETAPAFVFQCCMR